MKKTAIITGVLGQDGHFLSKKLIDFGYNVFGVVRKNKTYHKQDYNILEVDLTSKVEVRKLISDVNPTHIFNFAGVSNIFNPYDDMSKTFEQNCKIPINIIDCIIDLNPKIKLFQSSSSLMYAGGTEKIIDESSQISPKFPYGISKSYVFSQIKELRKEKGLHLCSGIFFNHDSEKRGEEFFTQKVVLGLKSIVENKTDKLTLGNLNVYKDISYAGDFMDGVISHMELDYPEDFVYGSGRAILLKDFVSKCFEYFDLDYKKYVVYDDEKKPTKFGLLSEPKKIKNILGWEVTHTIDDIIKIMIQDKIK